MRNMAINIVECN